MYPFVVCISMNSDPFYITHVNAFSTIPAAVDLMMKGIWISGNLCRSNSLPTILKILILNLMMRAFRD